MAVIRSAKLRAVGTSATAAVSVISRISARGSTSWPARASTMAASITGSPMEWPDRFTASWKSGSSWRIRASSATAWRTTQASTWGMRPVRSAM